MYISLLLHLVGICPGEPLVELLGLPLEAGEDDEGGDDEDHRPHAEHNHRHVPHIVLQPIVILVIKYNSAS